MKKKIKNQHPGVKTECKAIPIDDFESTFSQIMAHLAKSKKRNVTGNLCGKT